MNSHRLVRRSVWIKILMKVGHMCCEVWFQKSSTTLHMKLPCQWVTKWPLNRKELITRDLIINRVEKLILNLYDTAGYSWKPLRFAPWFPTLISCSPNLPRIYIRLCKHGNHFTFLRDHIDCFGGILNPKKFFFSRMRSTFIFSLHYFNIWIHCKTRWWLELGSYQPKGRNAALTG